MKSKQVNQNGKVTNSSPRVKVNYQVFIITSSNIEILKILSLPHAVYNEVIIKVPKTVQCMTL